MKSVKVTLVIREDGEMKYITSVTLLSIFMG